jgi:serine phosphatase RsbU (regulator of sigma subunit)
VLLCVTDGVTERRSGDRLLDDDDGLWKLLGDCPDLNAGSVVARIQRTVREFGSDPPTDDLALLVFRGL